MVNDLSQQRSEFLTCNVVAIGSGTGTGAENVWSQLVQLLAVLVGDDRASCGSCVGSKANTSLNKKFLASHSTLSREELFSSFCFFLTSFSTYVENNSADGRTGLCIAGLGTSLGLSCQSCVTNAVIVVEAAERNRLQVV